MKELERECLNVREGSEGAGAGLVHCISSDRRYVCVWERKLGAGE